MEIRKLGELCEIIIGKTPRTNIEEYWNKNDVPFIDGSLRKKCRYISNFAIKNNKQIVANKSDILMSILGNFDFIYVDEFIAFNQQVCLIKNNSNEKIFSKYLYFFLKKSIKKFETISIGTTVKHLNKTIIQNFDVLFPKINIQQQIINIIEQKEELFIKYKSLVKIDDFESFKNNWWILINIIEPFENKLNNLMKRKDNLKKLLVNFYYKFSSNRKLLFKNLIKFNITKYKNQRNYVDTSNIGYCEFISSDPIIKLKSRANLSTIKESFIFSKLDGENKIFPIWNSYFVNNFVYSTGFYNVSVNDKNLSWFVLGYLLSDDFKEQKHKASSGSVMMGINNESFSSIKISESTSLKNFNFMIKLFNLIELQVIYIKKIIQNLINLYLNYN